MRSRFVPVDHERAAGVRAARAHRPALRSSLSPRHSTGSGSRDDEVVHTRPGDLSVDPVSPA